MTSDGQIVHLIAAIGRQGQIGAAGGLPWYAPDDLRLFSRVTNGGVVVMGGRTFDALACAAGTSKPLPGRIVYQFRRHNTPEGLLGLIAVQCPGWPVWIAGGEHVYRVFAPHVTGLRILSAIGFDGPADRHFPFDAYGMDLALRGEGG